VGFDGKSVLSGHFFLEPFNFLIFEFHNLLAPGADEVIVVAFVRDIVVFRLRSEVSGLSKPGIAEQIERPVDGRKPQMRVGFGQLVVHGLCGNVLLPKEGVQNQFALAGEFELVLAEVLLQCLHFFYVSIRQGGLR
jgi:hypothetical protein